MKKYCSSCGNSLPVLAKFCRFCGVAQQVGDKVPAEALSEDLPECFCSGCKLEIPADAGFCPHCGLNLAIAIDAPALPNSDAQSAEKQASENSLIMNQHRRSPKSLYAMGIALILITGYSGFQIWSTKQRADAQERRLSEQHAIELNKLKKEADEARRVAEQEKLEAEQNAQRDLEALQLQAQQDKDEKEKADLARLEAERLAAEQKARLDQLELQDALKNLDQSAQLDSYGKQISVLTRAKSYPRVAQMRGWQGTVTIRLDFDAQGHAVTASIQHSSGYSLLDSDALEKVKSVQSYPTPPASLIGKPFSMNIPIKYSLE